MKTIKQLKKGDYFTLKEIEYPKESQVWVRDEYDHSARAFLVYNFADVCKSRLLKGDRQVFDDEHFFF